MPFVIDIDPVAFTVLGIQVRWYGLILVVAVAVAFWLAQREGRRRGIGPEIVSDAAIWVGAAALVGGRVLYVLQNELGTLAEVRPGNLDLQRQVGRTRRPQVVGDVAHELRTPLIEPSGRHLATPARRDRTAHRAGDGRGQSVRATASVSRSCWSSRPPDRRP